MRSKLSIGILAIIVVIVAISLVAQRLEAPTGPSSTASSTPPAVSSVDISSWKTFSNLKPAFTIEAPTDLVPSVSVIPTIDGPYLLELQFSKDAYFSTVLKDEAYVIVTASSTCPAVEPGPIDKGPLTLDMNGTTFVENRVSDVGAGNRYLTVTYNTNANGLCYRITFFDHGTNGAGFYLSDPDAIKVADATHDAELSRVKAIVSAMVGTFSARASQ